MRNKVVIFLFCLFIWYSVAYARGIEVITDDSQWQTIESTPAASYSIDVKSIIKDKKTGVISFFYSKKYDERSVQDGEIVAVERKMGYDPAKKMYSYCSENYTRKNQLTSADVLLYMVPE